MPRLRRLGFYATITLAAVLLLLQVVFATTSWFAERNGHQVLVITGGSMEPYYKLGDAVLLDVGAAGEAVKGTVVTYADATGELTTHRVVSRRMVQGVLYYQTQGDANASPDPDFTPADAVVGLPGRRLPYAGYLATFLMSTTGRMLTIAPALLLVMVLELRNAVRAWRGEDAPATGSAAAPGPLPRHRGQRRAPSRLAVRRAGAVLLAAALLAGSAASAWYGYVDGRLDAVARVTIVRDQTDPATPAAVAARAGRPRPLTFLVAGIDGTRSDKRGSWGSGAYRSDVLMVVHLPAHRKRATVVSIPRDTLVDVDGYGPSKINAAFAYGGPSLLVKTVEGYTGLRVDHVAIVDWDGFRDLTTALGGVTVRIPRRVVDTSQRRVWEAGPVTLSGADALAYVRQRHGLADGDFGRIRRQQNFLRATMRQVLDPATTRNPLTLTRLVDVVVSHVTVDADLTTPRLRELALSLRGLGHDDVTFVTVPLAAYDTVAGQSVVVTDETVVGSLFDAVRHGRAHRWVRRHRDAALGRTVS